jgi:hypothetical protein
MKHALKLICLPILILITVTIFATGCDQLADIFPPPTVSQPDGTSPVAVKGITLTEYFGGQMPNIYRRIDGSTVLCQTGDCPEELNLSKYLINEDIISAETSAEVFGDKITAYLGAPQYMDSIANCTTKSSFSYPYEYTIIEKDEQRIVATGTGNGYKEQIGTGCGDGEYNYRYETQETWIFTTEKLEALVLVNAHGSYGEIISAPGWAKRQLNRQYSEEGLTIECIDTQGFSVRPGYKVVEINGYEISDGRIHHNFEQISDTKTKITFAASYNAEYTIQAFCVVYGKNGAILAEAYAMDSANWNEDTAKKDFVVKVTDSPQGDIPESSYKK